MPRRDFTSSSSHHLAGAVGLIPPTPPFLSAFSPLASVEGVGAAFRSPIDARPDVSAEPVAGLRSAGMRAFSPVVSVVGAGAMRPVEDAPLDAAPGVLVPAIPALGPAGAVPFSPLACVEGAGVPVVLLCANAVMLAACMITMPVAKRSFFISCPSKVIRCAE
jgi:hypothetical protein